MTDPADAGPPRGWAPPTGAAESGPADDEWAAEALFPPVTSFGEPAEERPSDPAWDAYQRGTPDAAGVGDDRWAAPTPGGGGGGSRGGAGGGLGAPGSDGPGGGRSTGDRGGPGGRAHDPYGWTPPHDEFNYDPTTPWDGFVAERIAGGLRGGMPPGWTGPMADPRLGMPRATAPPRPAAKPAPPPAAPPAAAKPPAPAPPPPPPGRRIAPWLVGVIVPIILVLVGASLIVSSFGGGSGKKASPTKRPSTGGITLAPAGGSPSGGSSGSSGGELSVPAAETVDDTSPVTAPAPVVPVPTSGDPSARAAGIVQTYLTALATGDLATARAMTEADIDEKSLENLDSASALIVRSAQTGPDLVTLRLVIAEYRTTDDGPTTGFDCADWDVNVASGEVRERARGELRKDEAGTIIPGDLGATLGEECGAATFSG